MNFYLNIEFKNKSKISELEKIRKIQEFEHFLSLLIVVMDVLKNNVLVQFTHKWICKEDYECISKLLKNNVFGLSKLDYKFLFKQIKKYNTKCHECDTTYIIRLCDANGYEIVFSYLRELKKYGIIIDNVKLFNNLNKCLF